MSGNRRLPQYSSWMTAIVYMFAYLAGTTFACVYSNYANMCLGTTFFVILLPKQL